MSKQSLHTRDRRCIFREVFNSEQDTRKNGNYNITDVEFSDGKGVFNGTSSYMYNTFKGQGTFSIRIKFKVISIAVAMYLCDFRSLTGTGEGLIYVYPAGNFNISSGTLYVNGVTASTITIGDDVEIIVSGLTIDSQLFTIGRRNWSVQLNHFYGTMELFEIYNTTLTAEEIYNLHYGLTYKKLNENLVLNVETSKGIIQDTQEAAIVNTDVLVKRTNQNYQQYYNDTTSTLNLDSIIPDIKDLTVGSVSVWASIPNESVGIFFFAGDGSNANFFRMYINSSNQIVLQYYVASASQIVNSTGLGSLPIGWNHYLIQQNGIVSSMYMNGVKLINTPVGADDTAWFSKMSASITKVRIGNNNLGSEANYSEKYLDQIQIRSNVLTDNEIMQLYTSQKRKYE